MSSEVFEQTFSVSSPARLKLGNIRGSVEILPGEADQIVVQATKHFSSGLPDQTEIFMHQADDGSVQVETRFQEMGLGTILHWPCKVEYHVRVPARCTLSLSGVSSTAHVEGLEGEARISSVSGEISLRQMRGKLVVHTVSGQVNGEDLQGPLELDTVSGNIHLLGCDLPAIGASTVSGRLSCETPLGAGPYRFNSVSGDVRLEVPPQAAFNVHTHTLSGRLSVPQARFEAGRKTRLAVNGGGAQISHSSISGSLWIGPVGAAAQASPSADQSPSRMEILDQIERGELSVADGLVALKQ